MSRYKKLNMNSKSSEKEEGYQDALMDMDRELAVVWKKHLAEWKDGETTKAKVLVDKIFDDVFDVINYLG